MRLCEDCYPNKKEGDRIAIPERSIASGVDFGWFQRHGLQPLSLSEQIILSFNRLYLSVFKISSNTIGRVNFNVRNGVKCHAVLFAHDSPINVARDIVYDVLDVQRITRNIAVKFYDKKRKV